MVAGDGNGSSGDPASASSNGSSYEALLRLEIPATPAFVGVARSVVFATAATVSGIDDDRLDDLRIAVSEACTNAVEAHQSTDSDDRVVLSCEVQPTQLRVRIEDSGAGFDPDAVPPRPSLEGKDHLTFERGWGIQLIRTLVDQAEFLSDSTGTAVMLTMVRVDEL